MAFHAGFVGRGATCKCAWPSKFPSMSRFLSEFPELIKLEHSFFALPFAFLGVLMAAGGLPGLEQVFWVVICMFAARTAGMSFNRVLDAKIDAANPRTWDRAVASGRVARIQVWALALMCLALLSFGAWMLNPLAFELSFLCHILLFTYSLMKRVTWLCHYFLGVVEAFAPLGGWIAVTGSVESLCPVWLALATLLWFGGMDIIYALQDMNHDKEHGIFSIPAKFGSAKARLLAGFSHLLVIVFLGLAGFSADLGWTYAIALLLSGILFLSQHLLAAKGDNPSIGKAFFDTNVGISIVMMAGTGLDLWL